MALPQKPVIISTDSEGGGGIEVRGGETNLNNVTIFNNSAIGFGNGGGIRGSVNVKNSIIAGNTGNDPDCAGTLNSEGYNLVQDITNCIIGGDFTGNIIGLSPQLGSIQNNGGSTWTHMPNVASLAIDTGNPNAPGSGGNSCESEDQRNITRPQGARCDIGAVELSP